MKHLLWDIDGTLLNTKGAGAIPFKESIEEFLNCKIEFDRDKQSGLTDHQIVHRHIEQNKMEATHLHLIDKIIEHYATKLRDALKDTPVQIYPGIKELLVRLQRSSRFNLSIATGNCSVGAREKLKSGGLLEYFDESRIFCSEDSGPRSNILKKALSKMGADAQSSIVIGDTIHDWNAAKELSIPFILIINDELQISNELANIDGAFVGPKWTTLEFEKAIYAV